MRSVHYCGGPIARLDSEILGRASSFREAFGGGSKVRDPPPSCREPLSLLDAALAGVTPVRFSLTKLCL